MRVASGYKQNDIPYQTIGNQKSKKGFYYFTFYEAQKTVIITLNSEAQKPVADKIPCELQGQ